MGPCVGCRHDNETGEYRKSQAHHSWIGKSQGNERLRDRCDDTERRESHKPESNEGFHIYDVASALPNLSKRNQHVIGNEIGQYRKTVSIHVNCGNSCHTGRHGIACMVVCGMTIHDRLMTAQHMSIIFVFYSPLDCRAQTCYHTRGGIRT